jgi:hypothetical protein
VTKPVSIKEFKYLIKSDASRYLFRLFGAAFIIFQRKIFKNSNSLFGPAHDRPRSLFG